MTKIEYLEEKRDMDYHNLMCYSANLSMTVPREGYELDWEACKERCRVIEELLLAEKGIAETPVQGPLVIDGKVAQCWEAVREAGKGVMEL